MNEDSFRARFEDIDFENLGDLGELIVKVILEMADGLTGSEGAPGWVSLALIAVLAVLCLIYGSRVRRFRASVQKAREILGTGDGSRFTHDRLVDIDRNFRNSGKRSGLSQHLARAWSEFRETTVEPESGDAVLRNTARPDAFFSREALGQNHGFWRQVPALFVSVGLLLTFLGLVAALGETSRILDDAGGDSNITKGLKTLLRIASAKFIMSLTGLFCSILFILFVRWNSSRVDRDLHAFCEEIEKGCDYLSEQSVLRDMLDQAREQTTHLKLLGTELVAQIAKPLREDVPLAIREAVKPIIQGISRQAGEDMEVVAAKMSAQMTAGIQDSVNAMNETLGAMRGALESVVDRLDKSTGAMSGQVEEAVRALARQMESFDGQMAAWSETAVDKFNRGADTLLERMTQALDDIRVNTAEGTGRMEEASRALASAAENLSRSMQATMTEAAETAAERFNRGADILIERMTQTLDAIRANTVEGTGRMEDASRVLASAAETLSQSVQATMTEAAEASARELAAAGAALAKSIGAAMGEIDENLLDPMKALVERLRELGERIEAASAQAERYASVIENGAGAVASANADLGRAVKTLADAAAPVRSAVESIDEATRTMGDRVEAASRAMTETTEHTRAILGGVAESVEASQTTVRDSLESLQRAVEEFKAVLERYREIDRGLGEAFEKIEGAVRANIAEFEKFNKDLNREFGDALSRLANVIAQAEPFMPRPTE